MSTPMPTPPEGDYLSDAQVTALLQPLDPRRVHMMDGFSHLQGWDVRAQLNRVFGFLRWSADLSDLTLLYEEQDGKRWKVGYRATMVLVVRSPGGGPLATYTEAAVGESVHPRRGEAHDNAIKTAETQALKRCAVNLGTRFGLSLYDNGAVHDVVARTLVHGIEYPEPPKGTEVLVTVGDPRPAFPPPPDLPEAKITTEGEQ